MIKENKVVIGIASFVIGGLLFTSFCTTKINAGNGGVIYSMSGGVQDMALGQGWHIVSPFKSITEYPISTETVYLSKDLNEGGTDDQSFYISTKDGKTVNVDISYSYRMDFNRLPQIFTKFRGRSGNEIANGYMRDRLKEACNVISSNMGVLEVYGDKRQELNNKVYDRFKKQLSDVGIILETFAFTRVEADAQSMKAIQQKVDAKQKLERMKIEKDQAIVAAEKLKIEIEAETDRKMVEMKGQLDRQQAEVVATAKRRIISAESKAEEKRIDSEALAKANKTISDSLDSKVLEDNKLKKWDGKLPQVVGSGNTMFNLK